MKLMQLACFGPHGAGVVEELGLSADIDIQMGTLGKALGGFGAYVAGRRELIEWLVNRARSFIYTTGLPPSVAATALAGLDIVSQEPERRQQLWDNTEISDQRTQRPGLHLGRKPLADSAGHYW